MVCKKYSTKVTIIAVVAIIVLIAGAFFVLKSDSPTDTKSGQSSESVNTTVANTNDAHSSPETAITAYIDAMNRRDENALCEILADRIYQLKDGETPNSPDYYKPYMEEMDRFYGNDAEMSLKINKVEYGFPKEDIFTEDYIEDVASIDYNIIVTRGKDTESSEQFLFCIKVEGKWYVVD